MTLFWVVSSLVWLNAHLILVVLILIFASLNLLVSTVMLLKNNVEIGDSLTQLPLLFQVRISCLLLILFANVGLGNFQNSWLLKTGFGMHNTRPQSWRLVWGFLAVSSSLPGFLTSFLILLSREWLKKARVQGSKLRPTLHPTPHTPQPS